jgi:tetratricopeptide (TPR) repeat protein/TolB-like protein
LPITGNRGLSGRTPTHTPGASSSNPKENSSLSPSATVMQKMPANRPVAFLIISPFGLLRQAAKEQVRLWSVQQRPYAVVIEARWGELVNADLLRGFYLGNLLVEPTKGRVTGREGSERLASKAVEVLLCLAAQPGELVTREELLERVWGKDAGSQEALSHAIGEIRHALHDHHDDPEYIQTLPKRGYRLLITPAPADGDTGTIVLGVKNSVGAHELGLFENLKQRGVLETGLAYLIVGWLLIQIADIVFAQLLLPQWVGTFVTVLVIAGFPIAVALSWFLDFRDGRAIVHELSRADARKRRFGRTYISVIAALGIAAVVVFIYDKSIGLPVNETTTVPPDVVATVLPPVLDNSIAVLPFVNLDGSDTTQIFSNGLVDDVITRLSRVPGLLVSSRGDAFTLEPNSTSQIVRERLRVATYLEGSVQMRGDEIRVIVQLIDSDTGFHILSRSFDRPTNDFFDMRDEITELTVANVRVALPAAGQENSLLAAQDPELDVYLLYRRGIDASRQPQNMQMINTALGWFDAALNIDPEYAAAHAGKCLVFVDGYPIDDDPAFITNAESACSRALELNSNLDVVHTALGDLYRATGILDDSESSYLRALQINPTSVGAMIGLGTAYRLQQRLDEAEAAFKQAVGLHPGDWSAYNALGSLYFRSGRYREAATQFEVVVALDRTNMLGHSNLGTAWMLAGDFAAAASALQDAIDIEPVSVSYSNLGLIHYYLGDLDAAIANHRQAVELAPNDALTHSNLGDALWIAGHHDEATQSFEAAEKLVVAAFDVNPNDANRQMDLAWIRAMLGQVDTARTLIERSRSLSPDDPYVNFIDALIWLRTDDAEKALRALELAVDKGYPKTLLAAEPHLARLRQHPRFNQLLSRSEVQ